MNTSRNELIELLPWHENGTLSGAEADAVRELLSTDLEANRQLRELRALRGALADEPIMATNMALNLRRLCARIDPPAPRRRPWFNPFALAAAALLVVAGGLGIFAAGERAGRYHTLTTPADLPAVAADAVLFRVTVAAGTDAGALTTLAGDGARVLQGPDAYGVALLAVPRAGAGDAVARLQADPRLRFITPVPR